MAQDRRGRPVGELDGEGTTFRMVMCERCNENKATVHLTRIEQKKKREFHLCETCARQQGVLSVKGGFSVQGFLDELAESGTTKSTPAAPKTPPCPSCGLTWATFRTTGRLGCPEDYEHFQSELVPLIEKIHEKSQHVGKVPATLSERLDRRQLIAGLRAEQERAIAEENYEKAAELRDRLALLEDDMGSGGSDA